jgi:hypothetical protein
MNKTAMMQLRDRLQAKADEIKQHSAISNVVYGRYNELLEIISIINTELLEIEKQQMIDFHIECMKKGLAVDGSEWKELYLPKITDVATNYFNQTFNPK